MNGPTWTAGISGGGLSFDGLDDYVVVAGYQGISGSGPRTCAFWLKTTAAYADILSWGRLLDDYGQYIPGQKWQIVFYNEELGALVQGGNVYCAAPELNDGQWHHVAVVLEDVDENGVVNINEGRLYIDGSPRAVSHTNPYEVNTAAYNEVQLGRYPEGSTSYLNGSLDDVRIYDRALSEQEIEELSQ